MTTTYTIYRADGSIERGEVVWPLRPHCGQIERLVEPIVGHPMEHVRVLDPAKAEADEISRADYRDMFVDEVGHVRSPRSRAITPRPRSIAPTGCAPRAATPRTYTGSLATRSCSIGRFWR